jgi:hypothetical protein
VGALNVVNAYGEDGFLASPEDVGAESCGVVTEVYRDVTMTGTLTFYGGALFVSGTQTANASIFFPRSSFSKSCEEMQESAGEGVVSLSCTENGCGCHCIAEIVDGEFGHALGYNPAGALLLNSGLQAATDPNSVQQTPLATVCARGNTLLYDDGAVVITAQRRSATPDFR